VEANIAYFPRENLTDGKRKLDSSIYRFLGFVRNVEGRRSVAA
jgi:hypothetical protein